MTIDKDFRGETMTIGSKKCRKTTIDKDFRGGTMTIGPHAIVQTSTFRAKSVEKRQIA
jgi:hypothetical protein